MRKSRLAKICLLAAALAFGAVGGLWAEDSVPLAGHVAPQIRSAAKLERIAAEENVDLSLVVRLDQDLLDQTIAGLYGPQAPANKHFLSPAEFSQKFGLAQKRQLLKEFAAAAGLSLNPADDNPRSMIVKVSGPARVVENTFGVELHHYRSPDGQVFRGHDTEPVIPASLLPHLNAVLGLSNFKGAFKPHLVASRRSPALPGAQTASNPAAAGPANTLGGVSGPLAGLAPADIQTLYGLSGPLTGSGQNLALFELDGYNPADIAAYEAQFGLRNTSVTFVSVDGQANLCDPGQTQTCSASTLDGGQIEATLDIELMIALAPGTSIYVYTALNSDQSSLDAYAKIASDNIASSISSSWGRNQASAGSAIMTAESAIFAQMAVQGQSVFVAAGDSGAYDGSLFTNGTSLLVDDPASQPYVTGVGGTSISGSIYTPVETIWNDLNTTGDGAGGGGVADYGATVNRPVPLPSYPSQVYWPLPSYQNGVAGLYSQQYRNVPDVALNADPDNSPYSVYAGGAWYLIGGTSCASPLWAALTGRINQQRAINGAATLGFANPAIYNAATSAAYSSIFTDITSGNNGFYNAGTGYDNASGWGSFKGNALISALSSPLTVALAPSQFTPVGTSSITFNWSAAGELGGTTYTVQLSTNNFVTVNDGQTTAGVLAAFGTGGFGPALTPATSYFFRIQASNGLYTSAFRSTGTYTLAASPAAVALNQVMVSSISLQWTANGNPGGTTYRVDYWQATGSTTSVLTTSVAPTLTGLAFGVTYYITVGALNGLAQIAASGAVLTAVTFAQPFFTANVSPGGGTVSIHPSSGVISLQIPPGAITQAVALTLAIPASLPAAPSGAGNLTPTGVGIQILTNPDVEPLTNTILSIPYHASDIAGLDPRELILARYDPIDNVWVPLISTVDTANGIVTGVTSHWSLFQIMQNAPAASATSAKAFPNPWRLSQGPAAMTFTLMPAGARIRIYTLTGVLVKDLNADATGSANWDGTNDSGRQAASGFYFAYIEGAQTSITLKLAIQR
jgi:kumamolisin